MELGVVIGSDAPTRWKKMPLYMVENIYRVFARLNEAVQNFVHREREIKKTQRF